MNYQYGFNNGLYGANNQPYQPMAQNNSINWVQGESGAKSYLVAPGNTVLLMDAEGKKFYLKSADNMGVPSMRTFEYTEITPGGVTAFSSPDTDADAKYVTRTEMDEIRGKLETIEKRLDAKKGKVADEQ